MLKRLEIFVRPRWCFILMAARRFAAITAFLLIVVSLIAPIPFANVPPALIGILMALAYIEHDGMLFLAAFVLALGLLGAVFFALLQI